MTGSTAAVAVTEVSAAGVMAVAPKVSVLTITYNHGPFVGECLESVLAQQTDFAFEMVVGEDCSTDQTRAVCREQQARRPDRIRLLLAERNRGRHANFRNAFEACRGEYVALIEGDDYWTDGTKLRQQVALLDAHPETAICFHNVALVGERAPGPGATFFRAAPPRTVFTGEDLIEKNFIPTCSCVFRNRPRPALPAWYWDPAQTPYTDWVLHAVNAQRGDIRYIHAVMAAHRRHGGGFWGATFDGTAAGDIQRMSDRLRTYDRLGECLEPRCARRIRRQKAMTCFHLALAYREAGDRRAARRFLWRAIGTDVLAPAPLLRSLAREYWLLRRAGVRIQEPESRIQEPESRIQEAESRRQEPE